MVYASRTYDDYIENNRIKVVVSLILKFSKEPSKSNVSNNQVNG